MKYDVIVVGAGIMGSAAAYYLSKEKKKVLLLDQFEIKNDRNSSQDYSRIFRYEYGNQAFYTKMAVESLRLWHEVEKEADAKLYFRTGVLVLGGHEQGYTLKSYHTLKNLGYPVELLHEKELEKRYPQFRATLGVIDYNGGVLSAKAAVETFLKLAKRNGTKIRERSPVVAAAENQVVLGTGEKITCDNVVLACGTWISRLVKKNSLIKPTKQNVVYFKPPDLKKFTKDAFPPFIHGDRGFYGIPMHGINAVKISNHTAGEEVDPSTVKRVVSKEYIQELRDFLADHVPELAKAKVVKTKVCLYDMSPDTHFILDTIDGMIVASGFSGHGFKFAPLIGKILADLVVNGSTEYDISHFKADRFSPAKTIGSKT